MDVKKFSWPEITADCRPDIKRGIELMPAAKLIGIQVIGFHPDGLSLLEMPIELKTTFDGRLV
jgi:hypothetical protein